MSENTASEKRSRTPLDLTFTDVEALQRFVTDSGKILPRRVTGLTPSSSAMSLVRLNELVRFCS